ncbi:MAG: hypothetical protein H8E74_01245, partial [Gammaproteobacteria bacterium]|nr:hypothetical protein [Gammaproteobacteria bacterium]
MKYEELDKYLTNEVKIPGEEGNHVVSFNEILISLASTSIKGIEIGRFLNTA